MPTAASTPGPSTASATPGSSSAGANPEASAAGLPHGAPELEAKLPTTFHGQPLFTLSFGPSELADSPAGPSFAAIDTGSSLSSVKTMLGGRAVTRIKSPEGNALGDAWVDAIDDVMYGVQSKDEALAAEVIALLP